jgi:hypothetical protein
MNPTSVIFNLRINTDLKLRAEAVAAAENRTLTNYIETALIEKLEFRKPRRTWPAGGYKKREESVAA